MFGKAWYAHYAAQGLERLSQEELRADFNRFSANWSNRNEWFAHYKAQGLQRLTQDEQRAEYIRFWANRQQNN
jgi:hypothetical protein